MERAARLAACCAGFGLCVASGACGGSGRDVVPESTDVRVGNAPGTATGDGGAAGGDGYAHVAKRKHGVVALAEGRGFVPGEAESAVDHLADSFETCATETQR